jgi:hypothetical protein
MRRVEIARFLVSLALLSQVASSAWGFPARSDSQNASGPAGDSHLNRDGFLKIDGVPRLILGFYELPKEDSKLRELAENGFNLVRAPQDIKALDRVHSQNLYAWVCLDSAARLKQDDDKGEQKLVEVVNGFKDHPALLVWELPDEAVWNIW